MREAARAVAEEYSWPRFREGIREVLLNPASEWKVISSSAHETSYEPAAVLKNYA
jgi:hypothetical protein